MKLLQIIDLTLFMSGCASEDSTYTTARLKLSGDPLPAIRHVTDMKVSGDRLLFVFECDCKSRCCKASLEEAMIDYED